MNTAPSTSKSSKSDDNLLELKNISKYFGYVIALKDINFSLKKGEVHCLLGDNGAGKSTLIKILSGAHASSEGEYRFDGKLVNLTSPRDALQLGIATVYQDLALVPLMSVVRNFFMGREMVKRVGPFNVLKMDEMREATQAHLKEMGIRIRSTEQAVGTMSGGERQSLAIARAVHFGARVLILDEPTAALGVKQTTMVLKTVYEVMKKGVSVIFITHNVRHAFAVGHRFTILNRGGVLAVRDRDETNLDDLQSLMAGGQDIEDLSLSLGDSVKNV